MELLKPVTTKLTPKSAQTSVNPIETTPNSSHVVSSSIQSPDDALEVAKSKPDSDQLLALLRWLDKSSETEDGFNIHSPGPKSAQILYTLISNVVVDHWNLAPDPKQASEKKSRRLLVRCLRSVAGVGAIASQLRLLLDQVKSAKRAENASIVDRISPLQQLLQLLEGILERDDIAVTICEDIQNFNLSATQKSLQWREFLSLFASGRLVSIVSETNQVINGLSSKVEEASWPGDGKLYSAWLGRNIRLMLHDPEEKANKDLSKATAELFGKGLKLGYEGAVVEEAFAEPLHGKENGMNSCRLCLNHLAFRDQRATLYTCIRILKDKFLQPADNSLASRVPSIETTLSALAAFLRELTYDNTLLEDALVDWLTMMPCEIIMQGHLAHRAVALAISSSFEHVKTAFNKALETFGDKLFIKHTPIFQQEVQAQTLLLLIGYVDRLKKTYLVNMSKQSLYLNAISNRLSSSSEKSRFLGMVVGTCISELVDPKDKRMNFSFIDLEDPETKSYRDLIYIRDRIGSIRDLQPSRQTPISTKKPEQMPKIVPLSKKKPTTEAAQQSKVISIEELLDESASEDDDLPVYAKGDPDPSDSDDDPTVVQRNKPTAPVYIQDMIKGLRDMENYDRNRLALSGAATLIRRKAGYGTEVTDNAKEIANILVGLNDKWEMENFQRFRLQALVAILAADPKQMAPWFAETFYNGDYSISQRASVLTTLGLAAREIAGLGNEDAHLTDSANPATNFPSQELPERLYAAYASLDQKLSAHNRTAISSSSSTTTTTTKTPLLSPATGAASPSSTTAALAAAAPLTALSTDLSNTLIRPLAASAADSLSGPNALKIRTFSSRLAVERKRAPPRPNALAAIAATSFIFPLIGRWHIHLRAHGASPSPFPSSPSSSLTPTAWSTASSTTNITSPILLTTLLRTFALIIHAAGPTLTALPQVTRELWTLLLEIRGLAIAHGGESSEVVQALLFALLTLLEVNIAGIGEGRWIAEECARELLETREWVEGVLERGGFGAGGGSGGGGGLRGVGGAGEGGNGGNVGVGEDERVGMLAAALAMRCREIVERYQRVLMGDLVDFM